MCESVSPYDSKKNRVRFAALASHTYSVFLVAGSIKISDQIVFDLIEFVEVAEELVNKKLIRNPESFKTQRFLIPALISFSLLLIFLFPNYLPTK